MKQIEKYKSYQLLDSKISGKKVKQVLFVLLILLILTLFLPWTQNIKSKGIVTTLNPESRPQTINSIIGGRIEKWFVERNKIIHT